MGQTQRASTVAELLAEGYQHRTVKQEIRREPAGPAAGRRARLPGHRRLRRHGPARARDRAARRPRPRAARRARPGQDPADAHPRRPARRVEPRRRGLRDQRRPAAPGRAAGAGGWPRSSATACPCTGGTAASATPRSWPPPTPASATSSATSTRSRSPRAARSATPRRCTTASCRAPTAASSASTSCPTSPSASRWRCSTCWRSATSRSAATRCACPLDLLLVATANPEDYTNRGRIITPLKDRFGAEIRTHYPFEVSDEVALIAQEAALVADGARAPPRGRRPLHPGPARVVRGRPALRRLGPVRHRRRRERRRLGAAARRPGRREPEAVARVCDVPTVVPTLLGKVEFEMGEEGREREVLDAPAAGRRRGDLPRRAWPASTSPASPTSSPRAPSSRPASWCRRSDLLAQIGTVPGLSKVLDRLGHGDDASPGAGGGRGRVRPRGAAPDPPHRQGHGGRAHRLRRIDAEPTAARRSTAGTATAPGTAAPTRWRRPTTCGPPSTRSGATCWPAGALREALRELLRRGIDGRGGLDELAERVRRMRDAARRRGDLGGTLDQVRAMLDQALAAERDALAAEDTRRRAARRDGPRHPPGRRRRRRAGAGRPRLALAGGPRRLRGRSPRCCAARCSTRSSRG